MRTIEVALLEDESVRVEQPKVYMGEHRAAELAVTLPPRLLGGFDYYSLHFDLMDSGRQVRTANIYPGAEPGDPEAEAEDGVTAWLAGDVLHCRLPKALTSGSWLRCQAAACVQAEGKCVRIDKSAPFVIAFEGGGGEDCEQLTPYTLGQVERLLAQLDGVKNKLSIDWESLSGALKQFVRERLAAAMAGCGAGVLTAETDGQLIPVAPGVLWRLEFAPGVTQAALVLDDSEATPDYAPEFRLRVVPPEQGAPDLSLQCVGGEPVRMPDAFQFKAGRCYELNILDRMALAASWEVAA